MKKNNSVVVKTLTVVSIVLAVLKLLGVINLSWWIILLPFIVGLALNIVALLLLGGVYVLNYIKEKKIKRINS